MRLTFSSIVCAASVVLVSSPATATTAQSFTVPVTVPVGGTLLYPFVNGPFMDCGNNGTVTNLVPGNATVSPAATFSTPGSTSNFTITGVHTGTDLITIVYHADPSCTYVSGTITLQVGVTPATTPPLSSYFTNVNTLAAGHPISTATGELFGHDEVGDLDLGGPLDLAFQRYYASLLVPNGVTSALGSNWMHNFDVKAAVNGSAAAVTLFRGKIVKFTLTSGVWQLSSTERRPYQFAAAGNGYQFLDAVSNLIYTFNSAGALIGIKNRNGVALTVTQAASGVGPSQVSDGLGRTLTFTYTGSNLTRVQDQSGRSVNFQYTAGNLTAWTNANGQQTIFAYNSTGTGLMTVETRPAGNQPFTQAFDSQGRVSGQSDSFSTTMSFAYAASNGGATVSEPGGLTVTAVNDAQFNLTTLSDSGGGSSKYTYDANNRPLSITDRTAQKTTATYDAASGLPASVTDQLGNTTSFTYAASVAAPFTFYDLATIHFADGSTASLARDALGNITGATDQAGNTWNATWTAQGEIATLTNPAGGVTHFSYGNDGTLTAVQAPSGDTTNVAYDTVSRPNLITNPDSTARSLQYDADDNVLRFTDERGKSTATSIDANDNLRTVTDPLSALTTYIRDTDDRLTSVIDPLGNATVQAFDSASRLHSVTNAAGNSATYSYNSLNQTTGVVDASGNGYSYTLDAEGRILASTDALSRTIRLTRDARGLVTGLTTANNEQFSQILDTLGRTVSTKDALSRAAKYTWDPRGLLNAEALPGGINASFGFNAMGLRTSITDPDANIWNQGFDASGRPVSSTDPLGQVSSTTYDSRQRPSVTTFPNGTLQYQYDPAGHLLSETYSDGTSLNYTYDADGHMTGGTGLSLGYNAVGDMISSNGLLIGHDTAGRVVTVSYAPGKAVAYTYNNRGLLTEVAEWIGTAAHFTYDAAGQLTSATYDNGVSQTNTFDPNGRLLTYSLSNGGTPIYSASLTRDALGRVTSDSRTALGNIADDPTGTVELAYNAAAEVIGSHYDALGRLTSDPVRSYVWDLASRLTSYSGSDGSATFSYDALGQRTSRTSSGVTETYVLNYALPLPSVSVVRVGGVDQTYYVWLPDGTLLESIGADGTRRFYHFDESGNTNALTDGATGAVTDTYAVTPYGEILTSTGSTANPFVFQGQFGVMKEGSTPLYYMRARYFDGTTARFIARDPLTLTDAKQIDPYQFVSGNPLEHADPSGMGPPAVDYSPGRELRTTNIRLNTDGRALGSDLPSDFSYFDLSGTWSVADAVDLRAGVHDVFDTSPPVITSPLQILDTNAFLGRFRDIQNGGLAQGNGFTSSSDPAYAVEPPVTSPDPIVTTSLTSLLFPFVTNQLGFDTGLAIAHTSTDPFGITGQTTGTVYAQALSGIAAGFQGYMIAYCQFQYAHGFAFITDGVGANGGLSQGYLAGVIPRLPPPPAASPPPP